MLRIVFVFKIMTKLFSTLLTYLRGTQCLYTFIVLPVDSVAGYLHSAIACSIVSKDSVTSIASSKK